MRKGRNFLDVVRRSGDDWAKKKGFSRFLLQHPTIEDEMEREERGWAKYKRQKYISISETGME